MTSTHGSTANETILREISPATFLSDFWQRKPCLVRGALPDFKPPLSPDELAGLALEAEVESRLVIGSPASDWQVEHGPLAETRFATLPPREWTLLVQAVDLWVPGVADVLKHFDFLPAWRLDDIMISFATDGGSVGPHFDHYDVFLLQVEGKRRWQIGQTCDENTPLVANAPLKLLETFEEEAAWTLEPGDMLYLPPGVAHWGVAEGDCVTWSVGFRSPTLAECLSDLAAELMARGDDRVWRDPPLSPSMAGDQIHPHFIQQAQSLLESLASDTDLIQDWFARYMTAPKYPELTELTGEARRASVGRERYINGERSTPSTDDL